MEQLEANLADTVADTEKALGKTVSADEWAVIKDVQSAIMKIEAKRTPLIEEIYGDLDESEYDSDDEMYEVAIEMADDEVAFDGLFDQFADEINSAVNGEIGNNELENMIIHEQKYFQKKYAEIKKECSKDEKLFKVSYSSLCALFYNGVYLAFTELFGNKSIEPR
jgi:hypothetical protein